MVFTLSWFGFVWGYPTRLSLVLRTREGEWWDSRVISSQTNPNQDKSPPTSLPDEWHWNSTPARQGCLHRFTGAGRRLVTKEPRARGENPPGICEARRAPPGAGRDPLEEMFGVRMVDHESLFFVFIETFGSCDSQLDCFYCVARY
ncbi:hypothetical protein PAPYR_11170 [Paratrimastix pyriformis]|uniref:Uncharacterized protein n=1 Tax=Paratrimastix pyriformis TaxID=342808 RepID=A0ABQ8U702_9EUKA|nr:hypothetical protein PAPYR_11170 [Paratrimastix pyriformis]